MREAASAQEQRRCALAEHAAVRAKRVPAIARQEPSVPGRSTVLNEDGQGRPVRAGATLAAVRSGAAVAAERSAVASGVTAVGGDTRPVNRF